MLYNKQMKHICENWPASDLAKTSERNFQPKGKASYNLKFPFQRGISFSLLLNMKLDVSLKILLPFNTNIKILEGI